ncbi:MAG: complex I subunit 5 family protein [Pseudobdellovibrionaceae bacterium]|jgi:multicomponent Na+:H+ antiporter subunit D
MLSLAILPLILAFFFGISSWLLQSRPAVAKRWSYMGSWAGLIVSGLLFSLVLQTGPLSLQASGWPAPFGISFHLDLLSLILIFISYVLLVACHSFAFGFFEDKDFPALNSLIHFLMMGVIGSFSTADLFNLYVWFEVLLISSFSLMGSRDSSRSMSGLIKYMVLNLAGSALFLLGLGLLYNSSGTLNWQQLGEMSQFSPAFGWSAILLLIAFLMKSGTFPFYSWLPTSYPSVPAPLLALFAGLLTKVGVYTLIRFYGMGFPGAEHLNQWFYPLAGATMLFGVWGAVSQRGTKSILSFHIISQIGYMVIPLGLGTQAGIAVAIFYLIHHMIVKTNLFLVAGLIEKKYGSTDLKALGGLRQDGVLAIGFLIPALSLAGVPPLSGFWAKLLVIDALAQEQKYFWLGLSLFVGLFTLYSMTKIWAEAFQKSPETTTHISTLSVRRTSYLWMITPIFALGAWTVVLGFFPSVFYSLAELAAR